MMNGRNYPKNSPPEEPEGQTLAAGLACAGRYGRHYAGNMLSR